MNSIHRGHNSVLPPHSPALPAAPLPVFEGPAAAFSTPTVADTAPKYCRCCCGCCSCCCRCATRSDVRELPLTTARGFTLPCPLPPPPLPLPIPPDAFGSGVLPDMAERPVLDAGLLTGADGSLRDAAVVAGGPTTCVGSSGKVLGGVGGIGDDASFRPGSELAAVFGCCSPPSSRARSPV